MQEAGGHPREGIQVAVAVELELSGQGRVQEQVGRMEVREILAALVWTQLPLDSD